VEWVEMEIGVSGGADWVDGRDRGEKGGRGNEILGGWGVRRRVLGRGV